MVATPNHKHADMIFVGPNDEIGVARFIFWLGINFKIFHAAICHQDAEVQKAYLQHSSCSCTIVFLLVFELAPPHRNFSGTSDVKGGSALRQRLRYSDLKRNSLRTHYSRVCFLGKACFLESSFRDIYPACVSMSILHLHE